MTTRELIEAVPQTPERLDTDLAGELMHHPRGIYTYHSDHDALRAATLAVLDEVIPELEKAATGKYESTLWLALNDTRALRERVKG